MLNHYYINLINDLEDNKFTEWVLLENVRYDLNGQLQNFNFYNNRKISNYTNIALYFLPDNASYWRVFSLINLYCFIDLGFKSYTMPYIFEENSYSLDINIGASQKGYVYLIGYNNSASNPN